jgi:hypothetical protein
MPRVLNMRGRRGAVPPGAVYVGRRITRIGLAGSKWANPFKIGLDGTRAEGIEKYRAWLLEQPELMAALPELRGKDLACWCAPDPCHGDARRACTRRSGEPSPPRRCRASSARRGIAFPARLR